MAITSGKNAALRIIGGLPRQTSAPVEPQEGPIVFMQRQDVPSLDGAGKDAGFDDGGPICPFRDPGGVREQRQTVSLGFRNVHRRPVEARQPDVPLDVPRVDFVEDLPIIHNIPFVLPGLHVLLHHALSRVSRFAPDIYSFHIGPTSDGDGGGRDRFHLPQHAEIAQCFHEPDLSPGFGHTAHKGECSIGTDGVQSQLRGLVGVDPGHLGGRRAGRLGRERRRGWRRGSGRVR
ncbi:MAG: hypothetical protein BWY63_03436 [Chloroflexi bacterium ADurb.Bin360]|nr:MAG: hypothetical protein BWY63_03436 [Chloroflexi bacterium ADurb.Bin360]